MAETRNGTWCGLHPNLHSSTDGVREVNAYEYIQGFSLYACFGSYAGFQFRWNRAACVLTLGWFAVGAVRQDIENVVALAHHLLQRVERDHEGPLVVQISDNTNAPTNTDS